MQPKRDKLTITVFPPSDVAGPDDLRMDVADDAIATLARLIGRQIAREQFQRRIAAERKTTARMRASSSGKD